MMRCTCTGTTHQSTCPYKLRQLVRQRYSTCSRVGTKNTAPYCVSAPLDHSMASCLLSSRPTQARIRWDARQPAPDLREFMDTTRMNLQARSLSPWVFAVGCRPALPLHRLHAKRSQVVVLLCFFTSGTLLNYHPSSCVLPIKSLFGCFKWFRFFYGNWFSERGVIPATIFLWFSKINFMKTNPVWQVNQKELLF